MGTNAEDCLAVGKLIGIKVILNELIAYRDLGRTIKFRDEIRFNGTFESFKNGSLTIPNDITMIWNVSKIFTIISKAGSIL
jgi:nucleoside permease NupC